MTKTEFNRFLKQAGLSKKEFAKLTGYAYSTVANWGTEDKPIPSWVKSWIENHIKAKTLDSVKEVLCNAPDIPAD
jgi:hypothetical protein